MSDPSGRPTWEVARDIDEVHDLLLRCDAYQAATTSTGVPTRNWMTTQRRVEYGQVHLLRQDGRPLAAITVSADPPFALPPFLKPTQDCRYISRLSVCPDELTRGTLAGLQCLRRAVEVARSSGGRVLWSEANPDLQLTWRLLTLVGFRQRGPVSRVGRARRAYLERPLN